MAAPALAQTQTMEPAAPATQLDQTPNTGGTIPAAPDMPADVGTQAQSDQDGNGYRSYAEADHVERDIQADDGAGAYMDATVVNSDGDEIGTVADLVISEEGAVDRAVVDVSDFLGEDERYVVVELDRLNMGEGDASDDEFVLDASEDEVSGMDRFTQDDDRWTKSSD